ALVEELAAVAGHEGAAGAVLRHVAAHPHHAEFHERVDDIGGLAHIVETLHVGEGHFLGIARFGGASGFELLGGNLVHPGEDLHVLEARLPAVGAHGGGGFHRFHHQARVAPAFDPVHHEGLGVVAHAVDVGHGDAVGFQHLHHFHFVQQWVGDAVPRPGALD